MIQQIENKLEAIKYHTDQFHSLVDEIRADNRYTQEAKQEQLEEFYKTAKSNYDTQREEVMKIAQNEYDILEKNLLQLNLKDSSDVISWRDAVDRTLDITNLEDAERLMERAKSSGDEHIMKALILRAIENEWAKFFEQHSDFIPQQRFNDYMKKRTFYRQVLNLDKSVLSIWLNLMPMKP